MRRWLRSLEFDDYRAFATIALGVFYFGWQVFIRQVSR
jgi:hypothetical protein